MIYGLSHKFDNMNNDEIANEIIRMTKEEGSVFEIECTGYEVYYDYELGSFIHYMETPVSASPYMEISEDEVKVNLIKAMNNEEKYTIYFNC